jgi:cyclophilin family peptidyl-prolyl cis-trans isomerase
MQIDVERPYQAIIHTERGDISIELLPLTAPATVNNFVVLARDGFYDDTTFHRVVPGFLAQAGDPGGTGRGGPGYRFPDEISETPFVRGTVGMANAGPNTNGSQFYLLLADAPHLNGRYTAFGRVTDGFEVADALTARDPGADVAPGDRIDSVEIVEG